LILLAGIWQKGRVSRRKGGTAKEESLIGTRGKKGYPARDYETAPGQGISPGRGKKVRKEKILKEKKKKHEQI